MVEFLLVSVIGLGVAVKSRNTARIGHEAEKDLGMKREGGEGREIR